MIQIGMGQKQGRIVVVHVRMGFGQFEIGHHVGDPHHLLADAVGQGAHLGAKQGAVAHIDDLFRRHLGQQTDGHGALQLHIAAANG